MSEGGPCVEAVVHTCRARVELAQSEASLGETVAGALVLQAGTWGCEFERVEIGLVWETVYLVLETVDGNPVWERLVVPPEESLRLLFFLRVPRGADHGGAAQVRATLRAAGMRSRRLSVPVTIRMPALFTRVVAELEEMTDLRASAWLSLPSGRGAEAWLRPEPGQPSSLSSVYLRLVPGRRTVRAEILVQRSARPELGPLRHAFPGKVARIRAAFDESEVEAVRAILEERLRPHLCAALALPRPAPPPPPGVRDLPRPSPPPDDSL